MSFVQTATPRCSIDIYPFEGGPFTIDSDNGQIIALSTRKNISNDTGEFTLTLAPGGPNGTEVPPTWTQVITPMSFAVIAMQRAHDEAAITMLGVVTEASESQAWRPEGQVTRTITISGKDFGYFFAMFSYYSLWFLAAQGVQLTGTVPEPSQGLPTLLGAALIQGEPSKVGAAWFNTIMAGASGILSNTFVPYRGTRVTFTQAMASFFEDYPAFIIPFGDSFIGYEGPWIQKFRQIFAMPWYEFFINTAPTGFYKSTTSGQVAASGYAFTSSLLGEGVTASPFLVARLTPFPHLTNSSSDANGSAPFDGIDTTAWNALPLFQPDSNDQQNLFPFISSTIGFSEAEAMNVYLINPTWFRGLYGGAAGGGNANLAPLFLNFSSAGDTASIHRYGFRIGNGTISWFSDLSGDISSNQTTDLSALMADVIARYASFYEPLPLMAQSSVTMPLRPDIIPGCRFRNKPFKGDMSWDFYIDGVDNNFQFGGPSTTTVTLSRGLPSSVYADSSVTGVLFNALKGNAMRRNGSYSVGIPSGLGTPLAAIPPTAMASWLSQVAPIYSTAQAVSG